jgi:hypothetical protein
MWPEAFLSTNLGYWMAMIREPDKNAKNNHQRTRLPVADGIRYRVVLSARRQCPRVFDTGIPDGEESFVPEVLASCPFDQLSACGSKLPERHFLGAGRTVPSLSDSTTDASVSVRYIEVVGYGGRFAAFGRGTNQLSDFVVDVANGGQSKA